MPRFPRSPAAAAIVLLWCAPLRLAAQQPVPTVPQAAAPTVRSAEERRTLRVHGVPRSFLLFVPTSYRRGQPMPLVVMFHAGGVTARRMPAHTGLSRLAEREGFVVAYPEGLGRRWNDGRGYASSHDDVGFARAVLDTLQRELSIDPRRIYATGISNGAMFAYRLACDLPGTLAAVAVVAGAMPSTLTTRCVTTAPLSVLAFQGTADPLLPYLGRTSGPRGRVLSAARTMAYWATVDGCDPSPATVELPDGVPGDGTRVKHSVYAGCREGRGVELYTIEGGGHTWPGGPAAGEAVGRVSREIDATDLIWTFFAQHPKPQ